MNIPDRIIALDAALDDVILARGERLAGEIEFAYEPDKDRSGSGVGKVLGGAALAGGYAGSAAYRGRKSGAGMKATMSGDMAKARSATEGVGKGGMKGMKSRFKKSKGVMRGAGNAIKPGMGTKGAGMLKKLRKKMVKFEEDRGDVMEFMYTSGDEYKKLLKTASPSKKAKILKMLKSRKGMAAMAGVGAAGVGGAMMARRKK